MLIVDQQLASTDGRLAQPGISPEARTAYSAQCETLELSRAEIEIGMGKLVSDAALGRANAAVKQPPDEPHASCRTIQMD